MFKSLRSNLTGNQYIVILSLLLGLTAGPVHAQSAAVAGKVVFATGNPVATDTGGTQRSLGRGDEVFAGDSLRTPTNSRLQVSFVDGAYISLQPDSEYKIEEYKYSGQPDGSESAVYRLVKGGVRAVTGLIGKEEPEAYKVETAVATIGIRGTGHNTRICQGDCGDKNDGLYHNTWEGITYVRNDVAETNVPAGKGVYVRDMNSPIQFLSQPSSVTAVETTREREREQREEEEQTTVVSSGNQRTSDGTQTVIANDDTVTVPGSSTVSLDNGLIGVLPRRDPEDGEPIDVVAGSETSVFIDENNSIIGLLTLENDENGEVRVAATIDPAAMRGGDDAASVDEFNELMASIDETLLQQFRENPATASESFINADGVGWGRWSGGDFLVIDELGETELIELVDNQSLHFIFGPEPPEIPTQGGAIYDFVGGTQSTSASGATIGEGVTEGFLFADFGAGAGGIEMTVRHDSSDYHVAGFLAMDPAENSIFDQDSVFATTGRTGSDCNPSCLTFIEGGFAGPDSGNGTPSYAGIEYDIQESDIIMGVAGFGLAGGDDTQVDGGQLFTAIVPLEVESQQGETMLVAGNASGFNSYGFTNAAGDHVGSVYTDPQSELRAFTTVDTRAMLAGNDPNAVGEFAGMLGQVDPELLARFSANPAEVADSEFAEDGSGWGRWTGGNILSAREDGQSIAFELQGHQSLHFIVGPESPSLINNLNFNAYYEFAGGTRSTSLSGDTIGNGVVEGSIMVNFNDIFATLDMDVDHADTIYNVNGSLDVDKEGNSVIGFPLAQITSGTGGGGCDDGCGTLIQGGFAGALDDNGNPEHLGISYTIQDSDPIMGVAGFDVAPAPPM